MFTPLEQFDVIFLLIFSFFYDFSFTNILLPLLLTIIYLVIFFSNFKKYITLIPTSFQLSYESIFIFIINIVKNQIGVKGYIYFPFILTVFLFILISNFISLMPFGIAITSHLIILLFLSLGISLAVFIKV